MDKRRRWRLAGWLLVAGVAVSLVAGVFHAEAGDANDHVASFAAYAASGIWTFVHLGQFVGMALLTAGLFVLLPALQSFLLGTALVMFGIVIAAARQVSRVIGYLMAVSGAAYLVQGWIIGAEGFAAANTWPTLAGIAATVTWTVWLLISALRMKTPARPTAGR